MDESKLQAIVASEIRQAVGYIGGEISEQRRKALDYYNSEPLGNEVEGRSKVISSDVQDSIESVMPFLMEIFNGSDEVVRFEPTGPEDEEFAKQATDYVGYIFMSDNPGFEISHDVIKDGLLQKNGVTKTWWDESEETKKETFEGLNLLALQDLLAAKDGEEVEVLSHDSRPAEPEEAESAPDGTLYSVQLKRTTKKGRAKTVVLPPEEFLISRRAIDLETARFTGHRVKKTISDLIEEGYDPEVVKTLPSGSEMDYSEEAIARFSDEEYPGDTSTMDNAAREVWVTECYIRSDYDGDGITEMRQVVVAGPGLKILKNEEVDEHPFDSATPIRMPHKWIGRSLADLAMDIQDISSMINRQLLDNMYQINNAREAISSLVNKDDALSKEVGQLVRVNTEQSDVAGHIVPLVTPTIGNAAFPLLEHWQGQKESRLGVTRYNQGTDASSLNKTATGINQILGQAQRRLLLIARVYAEVFYKKLFRRYLRLVIKHQDRPRMIRLRNQWVEMDPRHWNASMDATVAVGLGYGTKEQQSLELMQVLQATLQVVELQGGVDGPIVTAPNVYHQLKKWLEAKGFKNADQFYTDPQNSPPQQPKPDPEMMKIQAEMQVKQAEFGLKKDEMQAKLQFEKEKHEQEMMFEREKFGMETQMQLQDMQMRGQEMQLNAEGQQFDRDMKRKEFESTDQGVQSETLEQGKQLNRMNQDALARLQQLEAKNTQMLAQIQAMLNAPKQLSVVRQGGRIVGATVEQGGQTTQVTIQ